MGEYRLSGSRFKNFVFLQLLLIARLIAYHRKSELLSSMSPGLPLTTPRRILPLPLARPPPMYQPFRYFLYAYPA
ncbi:hypothetical protein L204_101055 [Cryptococcus depauperatus]